MADHPSNPNPSSNPSNAQVGSGLRRANGEQTGSDQPGLAEQQLGSGLRNSEGEQTGSGDAHRVPRDPASGR